MILHSEILAQPERLAALLNHQNRRYWILRVPFKNKMYNMFSSRRTARQTMQVATHVCMSLKPMTAPRASGLGKRRPGDQYVCSTNLSEPGGKISNPHIGKGGVKTHRKWVY